MLFGIQGIQGLRSKGPPSSSMALITRSFAACLRSDSPFSDCQLHHLYRAMGWLGEVLADSQQYGATPFSPRCSKDQIEEGVFARRQDLFTSLDLVFFDTTSIYFEGEGGETLGQYGNRQRPSP